MTTKELAQYFHRLNDEGERDLRTAALSWRALRDVASKKTSLQEEIDALAAELGDLALEETDANAHVARLREEADLAERLAVLVEPDWEGEERDSAGEVIADLIESKNAFADLVASVTEAKSDLERARDLSRKFDLLGAFVREYVTSSGWNSPVTMGELAEAGVAPLERIPPIDFEAPRVWLLQVASFAWSNNGNPGEVGPPRGSSEPLPDDVLRRMNLDDLYDDFLRDVFGANPDDWPDEDAADRERKRQARERERQAREERRRRRDERRRAREEERRRRDRERRRERAKERERERQRERQRRRRRRRGRR